MIDVFVIKGFNIYSETLNYITYIFININIEISINIKDRTNPPPLHHLIAMKYTHLNFQKYPFTGTEIYKLQVIM